MWEKFFDTSQAQAHLPWRLSNDMPYIRKLYAKEVSVREKDAIINQIKRQAFRFLESRIGRNNFDDSRGSHSSHSSHSNHSSHGLSSKDTQSAAATLIGKSTAVKEAADVYGDRVTFTPAEYPYDLSLRLSDLSIHMSEHSSSRDESYRSSNTNSSNDVSTPTTNDSSRSSPGSIASDERGNIASDGLPYWTSERTV